jgi:sugar-specific transcriptional regulator TrmB
LPETLLPDLEELGVNGSQARVLLALLQLGTGNSSEIARLAQVPRTAVYPVLQELEVKRLVGRVAAQGPALWASPGREEVLDRLESAYEARMREQGARVARVRSTIEELVPPGSPTAPPMVHFLPGPAHANEAYDQLLSATRSELLVFSRPPFSAGPGPINPRLRELLDRGVAVRVLFQSQSGPTAEAVADHEKDSYSVAGVQARAIDYLPIKLVISDRRVVLLAIPENDTAMVGFPTTLLVDNENYAAVHVDVFENYWTKAVV